MSRVRLRHWSNRGRAEFPNCRAEHPRDRGEAEGGDFGRDDDIGPVRARSQNARARYDHHDRARLHRITCLST